jgi:hypothetical protein
MAIIALYHGTIKNFDAIDVNQGKPYKDFGRGFYASRTESQARRIAIRNRNFENDLLKPIQTFLENILPDRLPHQMFFGTQRAADLLRYVGRTAVG